LNRDSETAKLILEIMVTIIISAIIWYLAKIAITAASAGLPIDIGALIDALIMLVGGYIVVSLLSRAVYRVVLRTSGEIAASSVRSAIRILGIGVLLAGAAGILTNPQAGLAIGGFIGVVAGLATQQVLSQAVAGLVILATRPFRIGDTIVIGSWDPIKVIEITLLFTIGVNENGKIVYVPNSTVLTTRIVREGL